MVTKSLARAANQITVCHGVFSYCSTSVKRHNDQGKRKRLIGDLRNSFREFACDHHGRECGGRHGAREIHSDLQAPGKGESKIEPDVGLNLTAHLQ